MTSAPPEMPLAAAIQPVLRPITSSTMTRLCDSAVVCSLSMASVQMCTAVSKPIVTSVPARSLSIVFGTPIDRKLVLRIEAVGDPERALAADRDDAFESRCALVVAMRVASAAFLEERVRSRTSPRIVPPRGRIPATARRSSGTTPEPSEAAPAVADSDDLVVLRDQAAHDRADRRVQARDSRRLP